MSEPTIKLLESGYWHVHWNANQWIQWPSWRAPTLADGFGWLSEKHVAKANAVAQLKADDEVSVR